MIRATTYTRLHLELLCKGEKEKGPTEVLRFTDTPYKRKADNDAAQIHRVLQTTRSDGWMLSGLHCISAIVALKPCIGWVRDDLGKSAETVNERI